MKRDLESKEDMLPPPSPIATGFASHDGDEELFYPGAKLQHTPALLDVYGKELASPYPAKVSSNIGH
jgi:hypothetical protein